MSLSALATLVLIPPLNLVAAAGIGVVTGRRWVAGVALIGLWVCATPMLSDGLIWSLERYTAAPAPPPAAIVILSANQETAIVDGRRVYDVGWMTLERERAGAAVARATHLPVLVTGGSGAAGDPALGPGMAASLHRDFGVDVAWVESRSTDTWQNAQYSAEILRARGIGSVYLVTHGWHMRRALMAFRHFGIAAIPAPVRMDAPPDPATFDNYLPRVSSWLATYFAIHEWIGCAAYVGR